MSDQIWNYYVGLVNEISRFDKPAKPIAQQRDEMIGRLAADIEQALHLLDRAYAILANVAVGAEPHGFGDLMADIDDFREGISWGES